MGLCIFIFWKGWLKVSDSLSRRNRARFGQHFTELYRNEKTDVINVSYYEKPTTMLLLLSSSLILSVALYLLNIYTLKRTGIKDSIFYFKCDGNAWIAETAWVDHITGQVHKIVTTSHWQDGVVSVLNDEEKIYHTKQPYSDREGLHRFHRMARNRFFTQLKWKTFIENEKWKLVTQFK